MDTIPFEAFQLRRQSRSDVELIGKLSKIRKGRRHLISKLKEYMLGWNFREEKYKVVDTEAIFWVGLVLARQWHPKYFGYLKGVVKELRTSGKARKALLEGLLHDENLRSKKS